MSFLQSLIGIADDDVLFKNGLIKLEKMAGNSGVDVTLIANIIEKSHWVMRELKLDLVDTTAHELYFALIASVKENKADWLLLDTDYVLMQINGEIVSLNLIDVIESAHHGLAFETRIISNGRRCLRSELASRYINNPRTDSKSAKEIAKNIGLIQKNDACYNKNKQNNKNSGKIKPKGNN